MIERNANRFHSVYEKAEQLFDKLSGINDQFEVRLTKLRVAMFLTMI